MGFERATQPEQRALRRAAIMGAALALFDEVGLPKVSLSEIARRSRISKANLYRYFESREAIYIAILEEEYERLAGELESRLSELAGADDPALVAPVVAEALDARPRLVHLSSLLGSVLEQRVSVERVRSFKRNVSTSLLRYLNTLHAAMPSLSIPQCERALTYIATYAAGIFHVTHPGEAVRELQKEPEFQWTKRDFVQTVADHTRLVLAALMMES